MRPIDMIVVHCAATQEGHAYKASDIDRWHKLRGFSKIGYHYVIDLDGTVEQGRQEDEVGAHVEGHNAHSIGVCYVGGLADDNKTPKDTRTPQQIAAMRTLIMGLMSRFPHAKIVGHRDLSPDLNHDGTISPNEWMKACPSFNVHDWLLESGLLPAQ